MYRMNEGLLYEWQLEAIWVRLAAFLSLYTLGGIFTGATEGEFYLAHKTGLAFNAGGFLFEAYKALLNLKIQL